jgi:branched-chain amino acid transport system substrate-binding protein
MPIAARLAAVLLVGLAPAAHAADRSVTIAIDFSLTGADASSAARMKNAALLAIEQANAAGGVSGYHIDPLILDDGTATAGQYDAAQAATNARKMVSDPSVIAAVGPQMSGAAKAMAPVLNEGGVAIVTPAASNGDLTSVRYADEYRASGHLTFFRTVTTDAYQGPQLANYFANTLHVKTAYVLDDTGAYGVGIADAFSAQAAKKGIKVLGRDKVDPRAEDYSAVMTKIKALNPDALYYGGVFEAGVKVIKQSYDAIPKAFKGGGDGLYGPEILTAAGFPAAEGWYITIGAPHLQADPRTVKFTKDFTTRFGMGPDDYSVTAFDATQVILAAVKTLADAGKPVTREAVRATIEHSKTSTLQGDVQFDANGDLKNKIISIVQVKQDPTKPIDDMDAQLRYVGIAPAS